METNRLFIIIVEYECLNTILRFQQQKKDKKKDELCLCMNK